MRYGTRIASDMTQGIRVPELKKTGQNLASISWGEN
jgi:hypothetical protein